MLKINPTLLSAPPRSGLLMTELIMDVVKTVAIPAISETMPRKTNVTPTVFSAFINLDILITSINTYNGDRIGLFAFKKSINHAQKAKLSGIANNFR